MTAAIFGLIGVVVGALVTGGTDLYLQSRRERAERKRAKRLVGDEVESIVTGIEKIIEWGHLPGLGITEEGHSQFLPVSEWSQHKTALALALTDDEWRLLGIFYYNVLGFQIKAMDLGPRAELDEEMFDQLRRDAAIGRGAMKTLGLAGAVPLLIQEEASDEPGHDATGSPRRSAPRREEG